MFSYFGSKSKLAKLYPSPIHSKIVEPFAGSARYSLLHWEREVSIYDINPQVIAVWHYLQEASSKDILSLPLLSIGDHIDDFELTDPEKWLIGFELCRGKAVPRKVVSKFSDWERARSRIAGDVHKIKHWQIQLGNYKDIPNEEATWFIDPPYILRDETGMNYVHSHKTINYDHLSAWIKEREGFTIVCAGTNDYWLDFDILRQVKNGNKLGEEKIFIQGRV